MFAAISVHNEYETSEDSSDSIGSSSSSDLLYDVSSLLSSSSSSPSSSYESLVNGPLFQSSQLTSQLALKGGLSIFYGGKSQSFRCLSNVRSIEDLPKKVIPFRKKGHKHSHKPKAFISKKTIRASCSSFPVERGSFRPPSTV